jgi:two-component system response regulator (stage 0 sporulation protein A)
MAEKPVVLLADDNEATCTLIRALLQNEYTVEIASDGGEAIEKLRTRRYDGILLDLRMPVVDGYGVLEYLAGERPDLLARVVVVTASLSPREIDRVRRYSICCLVPKPFEVDVFTNAVRECTGRGQSGIHPPILSGGIMLLLAAELMKRM